MAGIWMSVIRQPVSVTRGEARNSAADEKTSTVWPSDLMSLHMDSRKNRSSSTTETSTFCIMPPWLFAELVVRASQYRSSALDCLICVKNATGALPVSRKLWLICEAEPHGLRLGISAERTRSLGP